MRKLNELSLTELLQLKHAGNLDSRELLSHCRQRVEAREESVQAFQFLDFGVVEAQLEVLEGQPADNRCGEFHSGSRM